jgi:hypothetical protein
VTGFAKGLRFDQVGSALYVNTDFGARLGLNLEKWSVQRMAGGCAIGSGHRPGSWVETTESGVFALGLTASNSHWTVVDLDRDRELARVLFTV